MKLNSLVGAVVLAVVGSFAILFYMG